MSLLNMSFSASVLILAIVVIRMLLLHRLPKGTFLVLWGVALYRLMIPFALSSKFSIYSLVNILKNRVFEMRLPLTEIPVVPSNVLITDTVTTLPENISLFTILWLIGLVICSLFFLVTHVRCRREYKTALPIDHAFVMLWQQEHPMWRGVQILQSDRISAPLTYGIFRPVVLLPKQTDWANKMQLRYILTHEFVHIQRFDALTKLILAAALCVHWFNPFVWLMYILANRDIELSCDEAVVRKFGGTIKSAYALTLIGLAEQRNRFSPLMNNFSKNAIEERVIVIMKTKTITLRGVIFAMALITLTIVVFTTSNNNETFIPYDSIGLDSVTYPNYTDFPDNDKIVCRLKSDYTISSYTVDQKITDHSVHHIVKLYTDNKQKSLPTGMNNYCEIEVALSPNEIFDYFGTAIFYQKAEEDYMFAGLKTYPGDIPDHFSDIPASHISRAIMGQ